MFSNQILKTLLKKTPMVKSVLNLSPEYINLSVHTTHFYQYRLLVNLPFKNNSFDLVFCKDPHKIFTNPYHMYDELYRISTMGIIQTQSPVSIIMNGIVPNSKMITWSDKKTLNFMSYMFPLELEDIDIKNIVDLLSKNPSIIYNWYIWKEPNDLNINIVHSEDIVDYEMIFREAINKSVIENFKIFK